MSTHTHMVWSLRGIATTMNHDEPRTQLPLSLSHLQNKSLLVTSPQIIPVDLPLALSLHILCRVEYFLFGGVRLLNSIPSSLSLSPCPSPSPSPPRAQIRH